MPRALVRARAGHTTNSCLRGRNRRPSEIFMYEAHFGLSDLPFQISPDARFYVDAAPHCAALNALLAGLRRGDEFMLLTGDFGTGKTTVARRLLEEVDRERFVV